jgi:hypothetical protein
VRSATYASTTRRRNAGTSDDRNADTSTTASSTSSEPTAPTRTVIVKVDRADAEQQDRPTEDDLAQEADEAVERSDGDGRRGSTPFRWKNRMLTAIRR